MSFFKIFVKSIKKIFRKKKSRPKKKSRGKKKGVSTQASVRKKTVKKSKTIKKKTIKKKVVKKSPAKKKVVKKKTSSKRKVNVKKKTVVKKNKSSPKSVKKKTALKKSPIKKKIISKEDKKNLIGVVTHYFSRIDVAVIKVVVGSIKIGDEILIKGKASELIQNVDSLQIESVDVKVAKKGQLAGLKVKKKVSVGDRVYIRGHVPN